MNERPNMILVYTKVLNILKCPLPLEIDERIAGYEAIDTKEAHICLADTHFLFTLTRAVGTMCFCYDVEEGFQIDRSIELLEITWETLSEREWFQLLEIWMASD